MLTKVQHGSGYYGPDEYTEVPNALVPMQKAELTMSSKEIAELTGKRHDNVKRTVEALSSKGLVRFTQIEETSHTGPGARPIEVYHVNQRDSYVIVAQLSPEFTARLVDRWQELEAKVRQPVQQVPQNFAQALLLAAKLEQEREALALEVQQQEATIAEQEEVLAVAVPKAETLDTIAAQASYLNLRDAAKILGLKPKDFTEQLLNAKLAYRGDNETLEASPHRRSCTAPANGYASVNEPSAHPALITSRLANRTSPYAACLAS